MAEWRELMAITDLRVEVTVHGPDPACRWRFISPYHTVPYWTVPYRRPPLNPSHISHREVTERCGRMDSSGSAAQISEHLSVRVYWVIIPGPSKVLCVFSQLPGVSRVSTYPGVQTCRGPTWYLQTITWENLTLQVSQHNSGFHCERDMEIVSVPCCVIDHKLLGGSLHVTSPACERYFAMEAAVSNAICNCNRFIEDL